MPLLSSCNHFKILGNIYDPEAISSDVQSPEFTLDTDSVPGPNPAQIWTVIPRIWEPKWEKALPGKYIISAAEGKNASLRLKVEIETTDTAEKKLSLP